MSDTHAADDDVQHAVDRASPFAPRDGKHGGIERHVALIGMMGCGKTTVGRLLASQLDRAVVDLDARLVSTHAMSISDMFSANGELWFRDAESSVLETVLGATSGEVISAGGGIVLRAENRRLLREHSIVVWLRASVETLVARNGTGAGRPMLAGDPAARIKTLVHERASLYAEAADVVIDVDELSVPQTVECVRAAVRSLSPTHWAS